MVFKVLHDGLGGNLMNFDDSFGAFADSLIVHDNFDYVIATYNNNDSVDFRYSSDTTHTSYIYLGSGNDVAYGNNARQFVFDGSGNDYVALGGGDDAIYVGLGNDTYVGGDGRDLVSFQYQSFDDTGVDGLNSNPITIDLNKTTAQSNIGFQSDIFNGFEDATGGGGNDSISGNNLSNVLRGLGGDDTLVGRGGVDLLYGSSGADRLFGGLQNDRIYCGLNDGKQDKVIYSNILDASSPGETVYEFDSWQIGDNPANTDKIDLRSIDADPLTAGDQEFIWRGTGALTSDPRGEVRVGGGGPNTVIIYVDLGGTFAPEMTISLIGVTSVSSVDFLL